VTGVQIGGDGLAQGGDAVGGGIAVMAVAQRLDARLDDMFGRLEIGLADAEVDDVLALRRQRLRAREHGKGRFGAEPRQAVGEMQM
jgi:hypothetical protein